MIFNICSRLKGILLGILAIFKKALCCFSRRRKRSNSECEVLNMVSVIQNESNTTGSKNRNEVCKITETFAQIFNIFIAI